MMLCVASGYGLLRLGLSSRIGQVDEIFREPATCLDALMLVTSVLPPCGLYFLCCSMTFLLGKTESRPVEQLYFGRVL